MKKYIPHLFVLLVVGYLLFLIRPALLGQLGGTFKSHSVPNEYVQLEKFLNSQNGFSRTLWIPSVQRFGFYSYQHPAVAAEGFFPTATLSGSLEFLQSPQAEKQLQESAIRYVVVPYDSEGEIFLKDRAYSSKLYEQTVKQVEGIQWLHEISGFGKIHVFEVAHSKDHFWMYSGQGTIEYAFKNPTEYSVTVRNAAKRDVLVFSESYDSRWVAKIDNKTAISSKLFHDK